MVPNTHAAATTYQNMPAIVLAGGDARRRTTEPPGGTREPRPSWRVDYMTPDSQRPCLACTGTPASCVRTRIACCPDCTHTATDLAAHLEETP